MDSLEPRPLAPVVREEAPEQQRETRQAGSELGTYVSRRLFFGGATGALIAGGLAFVFRAPIGAFLRHDAVVGLGNVVVAVFTAAVWWSTRRMQLTSLDTLEHLRTEFNAEHRPWISLKVEPYGPLEFKSDGSGFVYLLFELENTGRVPATNVRIKYKLVSPGIDPIPEQRIIAEKLLAESKDYGISVFPGKPATLPLHYDIPVKDVTVWRGWLAVHEEYADVFRTHIVGCVAYRSPLEADAEPHQTGFIRELHGPNYESIDPGRGTTIITELITSGSILGSGRIT